MVSGLSASGCSADPTWTHAMIEQTPPQMQPGNPQQMPAQRVTEFQFDARITIATTITLCRHL